MSPVRIFSLFSFARLLQSLHASAEKAFLPGAKRIFILHKIHTVFRVLFNNTDNATAKRLILTYCLQIINQMVQNLKVNNGTFITLALEGHEC